MSRATSLTRAAIGIGIAAAMFAAPSAFAPYFPDGETLEHPAVHAVKSRADVTREANQGDAADEVDLFGNDVSPAIATYQLDADGSLYEAHSPQTMLAKLGPPKM